MERILATARALFAQHGFAGTSMRAVALDAGVDPRLVTYYFHDKGTLLEACLEPPAGYLEQVDQVVHGPMRTRGAAMVRNMLTFWEDPDTSPILRGIVLIAAHDDTARQRLTAIYRNNMVGAVADGLDDRQRLLRANLAASAIIGLCMTRYVYELEPLATMDIDSVVRQVGPTVQRYLSGRIPS